MGRVPLADMFDMEGTLISFISFYKEKHTSAPRIERENRAKAKYVLSWVMKNIELERQAKGRVTPFAW